MKRWLRSNDVKLFSTLAVQTVDLAFWVLKCAPRSMKGAAPMRAVHLFAAANRGDFAHVE